MSAVAAAVVAGTVATGYIASKAQQRGADAAANAELEGSRMAIDEQRRQFDEVRKILQPYVDMGTMSLDAQGDLIGLNGRQPQSEAIQALQASPEYEAMVKEGENAILQNASATGGLRGGNTQLALSRFRPSVLSQLINQQFDRLSGVTSIGQASATGQANNAAQTGANVSSLLQGQGTALANAALAKSNATAQAVGGVGGTVSTLGTLKLLKSF